MRGSLYIFGSSDGFKLLIKIFINEKVIGFYV